MCYVGSHWCWGTWSALSRRGGNYSDYLGDSGRITHSRFARVCQLDWKIYLMHSAFSHRTCFIILGLISSTSQGAEILDDYHWEATLSPLGMPIGICIPSDIDKFISVCLRNLLSHSKLLLTHISCHLGKPQLQNAKTKYCFHQHLNPRLRSLLRFKILPMLWLPMQHQDHLPGTLSSVFQGSSSPVL